MKPCIDLHMHSIYSDDGEFTPAELVTQCQNAGITTMAIADHNSVRGNEEAFLKAKELCITYIPAVELDCTFHGKNFHVLGYAIDHHSHDFVSLEENICSQCETASYDMLDATRSLGFQISETDMEQLSESMYWTHHWTGEMFGEALLQKEEYKDHPLLAPYRPGGSRSDNPYVNFYWDYYSQGKACYVPMSYPALENVVDIIHKNKGQAVLAHPGVNLKDCMDLLHPILQTGMDGIEAYSSYHSKEQSSFFQEIAAKHHLFVTCGSDFHGKTKPSVSLGQHGCPFDSNYILQECHFHE